VQIRAYMTGVALIASLGSIHCGSGTRSADDGSGGAGGSAQGSDDGGPIAEDAAQGEATSCAAVPRATPPALDVPTGGKTYYVGPDGLDTNDGSSTGTPFHTLQKGADSAQAGDTIMVMDGTYENPGAFAVVTMSHSGTALAWIVLRAAPGSHPHLTYANWVGVAVRGSYIAVEGLDIQGARQQFTMDQAQTHVTDLGYGPTNGTGIVIGDCSGDMKIDHIVVRDNVVYDGTEAGISSCHADYVTVEYNETHHNSFWSPYGGSGISLWQMYDSDQSTATKNFVRYNVSHENEEFFPAFGPKITDGNGIIIDSSNDLGGYKGRFLVSNNLVYGNGGSGIHSFRSDHVDMVNNTAYENNHSPAIDEGQIFCNASADCNVLNNIMWAPKGKVDTTTWATPTMLDYNIYWSGSGAPKKGAHDIIADPLFLNAGCLDFRLAAGSPAIDSATSTLAPPDDLLGTSRPQGVGYDRGAYELPFLER
jgi:hypothetical protein